ncbi:MAG: xanthine dehydrogenase family protein molybdopterin-binding subunit, partial [Rhodobacteraceae bacterium]
MTKQTGIGASSKRREDVRFLTGKGQYTDDINRPGQTYAVFCRSEIAHGTIKGIDTAAAEAAPGVLAVLTAKDFAHAGSLPCGWVIHNDDGSPMKEPKHAVLAEGRVRHVGHPYAMVVAETYQQAKDAAELVEIDIEELPAVVDMREAVKGGTLVHEDAPDNICFDWKFVAEKEAEVDAAIKSAAHVVTLEIINNRLIPNAMEPRAAIGDYDKGTGDHTLFTTSQNPHVIRLMMGAFVLGIPEHKLRVVAPDVGGG